MSGITFYNAGTIDLVNGVAAIVGHGTLWGGLTDGDLLVAPDGNLYELTFTDDTHATLDRNYAGSTVSGSAYTIMRVSTARDSIGDASRKLSGVASTYRGIANFTAADQLLKLSQATIGDKAGLLLQTAGVDKIRVGLMESGNFDIQWLNAGVWTTALRVAENGVVTSTGTIGVGKRAQVRVAATGNLNLASPGGSIDAVSMVIGDWFLAPAQTTEAQNGIYIWNGAAVAATRAPDFATYNSYAGALVAVVAGTVNANTLWFCSANEGGTLGTTDIIFTKLTFPAGVPVGRTITAGAGLTGGGDLTADRTISKIRSTATPLPNGAAAAGTSDTAANEDHVHPRDADPAYRAASLLRAERKGWPLVPSLDLIATPELSLPSWVSFSRGSSKWLPGPNGNFREIPAGQVGHEYDFLTGRYLGWSIEGASANLIRNNTMQGGVGGSPGTAPDNWIIQGNPTPSAGIQVDVSYPTVRGVKCIDLHIYGTSTNGGSRVLFFESSTGIAAVNGDIITSSMYAAVVGGSLTGVTGLTWRYRVYDSSSTQLVEQSGSTISGQLSGSLTRIIDTYTIAQASAAFFRPGIVYAINNGTTVDVTIRIIVPQSEKRPTPTSPILTSGSAVTRAADVFDVANLTGWFNYDEGGIYVRGSVPYSSGQEENLLVVDNATNNRIGVQKTSAEILNGIVSSGGSTVASLSGATIVAGSEFAAMFAYRTDDFAMSTNAGAITTDTSGDLPASADVTTLKVGRRLASSGPFYGNIKQVSVFGMRPPNANLPTYSGL